MIEKRIAHVTDWYYVDGLRVEETSIYEYKEYIPTTRKEKIKKKLNDIEDKIFYILFMIFVVPIGFVYFIIKDLILKKDDIKQEKVDLNQASDLENDSGFNDVKQEKVDLNQGMLDKDEEWKSW